LKTGPIILALLGIGLALALFFAPVKPSESDTSTPAEPSAAASEAADHEHDHNHAADVDAQIDTILQQMRAQELPPMQAVIAIRNIADEHPENVKANFTLGLMSIQTAQFDKAVQRFEAVLKADPQNPEAMRLMAQSHLGLGDTATARTFYQRAIENAPTEETKSSIQKELDPLSINP